MFLKTFLIVNTKVEVIFDICFFKFNNADMLFREEILF